MAPERYPNFKPLKKVNIADSWSSSFPLNLQTYLVRNQHWVFYFINKKSQHLEISKLKKHHYFSNGVKSTKSRFLNDILYIKLSAHR
jgi:hypothetical protein